MAISLYDISIPVFIRGLNIVCEYLKKTQKYADEKGIAHSEILNMQLVDDMKDFTHQVQTIRNTAKNLAIRVGGLDAFDIEDDEISFEELESKIQQTIRFLRKVDKTTMDANEDAKITVRTRNGETDFTGKDCVVKLAVPIFYFHMTIMHTLLRHKGVSVGKLDFLGDT